jgi:hypothetical protein
MQRMVLFFVLAKTDEVGSTQKPPLFRDVK